MPKDESRVFFEKLKMIEQFCGGDASLARKIIKGEMNDIVVIKGRFKDDDETIYGLFLLFVSDILKTIISGEAVVSPSASVYRHKPYESWRSFKQSVIKEGKEAEIDEAKTNKLTAVMNRIDELRLFPDVFNWVRTNDIQSLTQKFERIVNKSLGMETFKVILDFESTNSLIIHQELGLTPLEKT
jgi:hypothetical protein